MAPKTLHALILGIIFAQKLFYNLFPLYRALCPKPSNDHGKWPAVGKVVNMQARARRLGDFHLDEVLAKGH